MKLLKLLFRYSPALVIPAALAGVASGAANAALLGLVNTAFHRSRDAGGHGLLWAFAGLCVLLPLARAGSSYLLTLLGQRLVLSLRLDLTRRIFAAPLAHLEGLGAEKLLVALTQDLGSIVSALSALPSLFLHTTLIVGSLVYLGALSTAVLKLVLVAMVVGAAVYQVPRIKAAVLQRRARQEADRMWKFLGAVTGGMKELKLNARRQDGLLADLDDSGQVLRGLTVRSSTLFSAGAGFGQLLVFAVMGMVLFGPAMQGVDVKTLTGYGLVLLYMMTPLNVIFETIPTVARATVAMKRVEEIGLKLGDAQVAPAAPSPRGTEWAAIALDGVTHSYHVEGEDHPFTVGPVSLTLTPGEVVFLVGGNGSGKTSLAKLVMGLYAPGAGSIAVDGAPVTDASRDAYRQRFSAVFSDFHLFDRLYGLEGRDLDDRAAGYLRKLQLADKVRVEGGRLSTTALSQGQRKRLALLTAYLEDRPFYVFDEWAADQDPVFKRLFYRELLPELRERGKGVLVISHDDHYYATADRILKMDQGLLAYDGPPEDFHYALELPAAVA